MQESSKIHRFEFLFTFDFAGACWRVRECQCITLSLDPQLAQRPICHNSVHPSLSDSPGKKKTRSRAVCLPVFWTCNKLFRLSPGLYVFAHLSFGAYVSHDSGNARCQSKSRQLQSISERTHSGRCIVGGYAIHIYT